MFTTSRFSARPHYTFSLALLIGANILWATSYAAGKFILFSTSVTMMLALRMIISALILLPFLWFKRKDLSLSWRELPALAVLSLIGFVFNKLLEFGGLALTTASDVALLIASESIFTALLSWLVLHEPLRKRSLLALLIGFVGVYLIIEQGIIPQIPGGGGIWRIVGDLLVILALLVEAFYTVRGKSLLSRHSPLLITAASIVGSVCFWAPVAVGEIALKGWSMPDAGSWLGIVWIALFCTVLPYLAWFQGLRYHWIEMRPTLNNGAVHHPLRQRSFVARP